jgi:hypothetical protein
VPQNTLKAQKWTQKEKKFLGNGSAIEFQLQRVIATTVKFHLEIKRNSRNCNPTHSIERERERKRERERGQ